MVDIFEEKNPFKKYFKDGNSLDIYDGGGNQSKRRAKVIYSGSVVSIPLYKVKEAPLSDLHLYLSKIFSFDFYAKNFSSFSYFRYFKKVSYEDFGYWQRLEYRSEDFKITFGFFNYQGAEVNIYFKRGNRRVRIFSHFLMLDTDMQSFYTFLDYNISLFLDDLFTKTGVIFKWLK